MLQTNCHSLLDHIMLRKKIKYIGQGNKKIALFKYIKRRFFSIFESSYVD